MATPTFAAARALGQGEVTQDIAAAQLSGQNADGTPYTQATVAQAPSATGGAAGTAITASSANQANANAVATLPGVAGKTTWIEGFTCTATGATGALAVTVTVAGLVTGTMNFTFAFPAGVAVAAQPLIVNFPQPLPASGLNTAIVVTLPASGTGGTNATANAWGFQL